MQRSNCQRGTTWRLGSSGSPCALTIQCQVKSDFRAGRNVGVGEEDVLEVNDEKEDLVLEDLRTISFASP